MPEHGGLNSIGHQQLTVSTAAGGVGLTVPTGTRPTHAMIFIGGNPVNWRGDSVAPTATVGIPIPAGGYLSLMDPAFDYWSLIKSILFIRTGGADATADIEFFVGG